MLCAYNNFSVFLHGEKVIPERRHHGQHMENTHATALTVTIYTSSLQHPVWTRHTLWTLAKKTSIFYLLNQEENEAAAAI